MRKAHLQVTLAALLQLVPLSQLLFQLEELEAMIYEMNNFRVAE